MWKFKSLKGKDKWIFLLTVGVILCILAFPVENLTGRREDKAAEKGLLQRQRKVRSKIQPQIQMNGYLPAERRRIGTQRENRPPQP